MRLVDSHCHLDHEKFAGDREATIERARAAGVETLLAVGSGDGPPDLEAAIRLADKHHHIWATIGVHPHDASKATPETFTTLRALAQHPKVKAMGEMGLDFHYDFSPRSLQSDVFVQQLAIARDARLPIVIHTREAWEDTVSLLRKHWEGNTPGGVFHCFTGGPTQAQEALELGFHLSFGGVITFPKSDDNREAARLVPDNRLLVETDSPYLAPAPHRGKRNEPAFMVETVKRLAELRGVPAENIAAVTTANFERLCLADLR